jgi:hypothetical protein
MAEKTNQSKSTSPAWSARRMFQVIYWLTVTVLVVMGLTAQYDSGDFIVWPGIFVALVSFPVYVLGKKVFEFTTNLNNKLELSRTWRIIKVIYWVCIIVAVPVLLFSTDYYGNNKTGWIGLVVLIVSLPLYTVLGKLFTYIMYGSATHSK